MKETLELLKELTNIPAPSGNEMTLSKYIYHYMKTFAEEVDADNLGNVMACVTGRKPGAVRILLTAHQDEVSFIVRKIEPNGFIKIQRTGGIPEKNLLGLVVLLMTDKGICTGLIGTRSHHLTSQEERYQVVPMMDLYIDAGFTSAEEAAEAGVHVGTPVVYQRTFYVNGHRIFSNALDDRIGLASILQVGKRIASRKDEMDAEVWIGTNVQEEWSLRGIIPLTRMVEPDAVLCCDMYPATDTPDLKGIADLGLGNGPVISEYNFHGRGTLMGLIPDAALRDTALEAARQLGIAVQRGVLIGVLTDAAYVQTEGKGIATLDIAIPARYSHSAVESSDLRDLKEYMDLLERLIEIYPGRAAKNRRDLIVSSEETYEFA